MKPRWMPRPKFAVPRLPRPAHRAAVKNKYLLNSSGDIYWPNPMRNGSPADRIPLCVRTPE